MFHLIWNAAFLLVTRSLAGREEKSAALFMIDREKIEDSGLLNNLL